MASAAATWVCSARPLSETPKTQGFLLTMGFSHAISRTGIDLISFRSSNSSSRGLCNEDRRRFNDLTKPFRLTCSSKKHLFVSSGMTIVISGYWVGPEVEDGCGYTEAIVVQVFKY
ncbi:hypothetical protein Syun_007853 [Stephania yunnanensis]|uniref:Uncharacterized protein n=1 Tax=Stephania yunnanensis TaxID=152371 RepID=A0AAP0PYW3_9MAGN